MSLKLNQKCLDRLVESVASKLQNVKVKNCITLDIESMIDLIECDKILSQTGEQKKLLTKYISDMPLFDFILETISRNLVESREYNADSESDP
jgi:BRCT domain type II-containing protein